MIVKYFLIFILSFLLISCSESGYAFKFDVEEVETTITINEDECRDVLEKGNRYLDYTARIIGNERGIGKAIKKCFQESIK